MNCYYEKLEAIVQFIINSQRPKVQFLKRKHEINYRQEYQLKPGSTRMMKICYRYLVDIELIIISLYNFVY